MNVESCLNLLFMYCLKHYRFSHLIIATFIVGFLLTVLFPNQRGKLKVAQLALMGVEETNKVVTAAIDTESKVLVKTYIWTLNEKNISKSKQKAHDLLVDFTLLRVCECFILSGAKVKMNIQKCKEIIRQKLKEDGVLGVDGFVHKKVQITTL